MDIKIYSLSQTLIGYAVLFSILFILFILYRTSVYFSSKKTARKKAQIALNEATNKENTDTPVKTRAKPYEVKAPLYSFEQLIVSQTMKNELLAAVGVVQEEQKVFDDWGLKAIEPLPCTALNFYGQPGTGKTLAAHALAAYLGKEIAVGTYAELWGDDIIKNINTIFDTAAQKDAVIFIDGADSLLSKGANATASGQILVSLENFHGVVIFATNIIENFNRAFETRVRHIHFLLPDEDSRRRMWEAYLPEKLPQAADVSPAMLAKLVDDISGREIKNAVVDAATKIARAGKPQIEMSDLLEEVRRIKDSRMKDHMDGDISIETRARQYEAKPPRHHFEQLIVSQDLMNDLLAAIGIIEAEKKIFDEWGLRSIEPFPSTALNFYGQPGTGKTLAAHALADHLKRPILVANYGEIQGMYVGDGARNTNAIFHAATRDNAVLFIDEADSLLSRRLTNVTHSADQAVNTLSNQMLICLENFHGVVIFATNMIGNYDKAFETRVRYIHFAMPDEDCRKRIWETCLPEELPRATDVSPAVLAKRASGISGREIKNAVIDAAARAEMAKKPEIDLNDLLEAVKRIKNSRIPLDGEKTQAAISPKQITIEAQVQQTFFPSEQGKVHIKNNHMTPPIVKIEE